KTLAKEFVNIVELRDIFVGISSQLVQIKHTHAKLQFKVLGFLLARDRKTFSKETLRLGEILARSHICFSEQAEYFSNVEAFGVLFIELQLRLVQKVECLLVTFIHYACICE